MAEIPGWGVDPAPGPKLGHRVRLAGATGHSDGPGSLRSGGLVRLAARGDRARLSTRQSHLPIPRASHVVGDVQSLVLGRHFWQRWAKSKRTDVELLNTSFTFAP